MSRLVYGGFGLAALAIALLSGVQPGMAQSRLERIETDGTLRVGWGTFPPYEFQDVATGELKGILISMAREVANRLDLEAEFTLDTWPTMASGIAADRFDVALMGYSDGRAAVADYSEPLYVSDFTAIVSDDSEFGTWDLLNQAGNTLAVTTGSSTDEVLTRMEQAGELKLEVRRIKDVGSGVLAVTSGNVDGYANQRDVLSLMEASQPQLKTVEGAFGTAWFGVVLPKGDTALKEKIDEVVTAMNADGTIARMIEDYNIVGAQVPQG